MHYRTVLHRVVYMLHLVKECPPPPPPPSKLAVFKPSVVASVKLSRGAHPGTAQQTVTGSSFMFSGGMPPDIQQSIPGSSYVLGGGLPPTRASTSHKRLKQNT